MAGHGPSRPPRGRGGPPAAPAAPAIGPAGAQGPGRAPSSGMAAPMPGWRPGAPRVWSARWTMPPGTSCPGRFVRRGCRKLPPSPPDGGRHLRDPGGPVWTGMGSSSAMTPPGPWPRSSEGRRSPQSGGRWRRWGSRPSSPEPQAKGRIERLWGTLQDRLVADSAWRASPRSPRPMPSSPGSPGASPPASGGRGSPRAAWRPVPRAWTRAHLQLLHGGHGAQRQHGADTGPGPPDPARAGAGLRQGLVEVRQLLDGSWRIDHHDRLLATQAALAGPLVRSLRRRHDDGPAAAG